MALRLYHKTRADFACVCTTLDTNFDSFPLVEQDRNLARASSRNLTAQSMRFRRSVAMEDQANATDCAQTRKVAKPLKSGQKLITLFFDR